MQNITDQESIDQYSKAFSDVIINQAYQNRERVSGQEILNLTPVRQVNLFVIKSLLFQWKKETEKLKSPYFDYSDPNVQKALSTFMNTVSRYISVQSDELKPLLKEAVYDSICLIFYPYDFYTQLIKNWKEESISLKDLKQINKYVKVNDSVMNNLVARMEQDGLAKISKPDALNMFNDIMERTDISPADTEEYTQQFNEVIQLKLEELNEPEEELIINQEIKTTDKKEKEGENNDEKEDLVTLNDQMQQEDKTTLANFHEKQKIEKISKYISINQKFMFINRLFDKDWGKFEKAISFLDSTDDKTAILNYLDEHAPAWREEGDEAEEFRNVLEKKLGSTPT
ncbi:MAG: hypothetical protein ACNS60_17570 [Candidatus Cyclobacteriaceae bacterium M2_1C_046]